MYLVQFFASAKHIFILDIFLILLLFVTIRSYLQIFVTTCNNMKLFYFLMTTLLQKLQKSYKYEKVKKDNVFVIRECLKKMGHAQMKAKWLQCLYMLYSEHGPCSHGHALLNLDNFFFLHMFEPYCHESLNQRTASSHLNVPHRPTTISIPARSPQYIPTATSTCQGLQRGPKRQYIPSFGH